MTGDITGDDAGVVSDDQVSSRVCLSSCRQKSSVHVRRPRLYDLHSLGPRSFRFPHDGSSTQPGYLLTGARLASRLRSPVAGVQRFVTAHTNRRRAKVSHVAWPGSAASMAAALSSIAAANRSKLFSPPCVSFVARHLGFLALRSGLSSEVCGFAISPVITRTERERVRVGRVTPSRARLKTVLTLVYGGNHAKPWSTVSSGLLQGSGRDR